jgi:hypothetical protein
MGYRRFWENKKASEEGLKECAVKQRAEQRAGMEEALLSEDTAEINLERRRERIKGKRGLGATGNGADPGFFCRPALVAAPKDCAVIRYWIFTHEIGKRGWGRRRRGVSGTRVCR